MSDTRRDVAVVLAGLCIRPEIRGAVERILPADAMRAYAMYGSLLVASSEREIAAAWLEMPDGLANALNEHLGYVYAPEVLAAAERIRAEWASRMMRIEMEDAGEAATPETIAEIAARYVQSGKKAEPVLGVEDLAAEVLEMIDQRGSDNIMSGIRAIDERMWGMWPGDVWVLAGRPSHGKSQLACNIVHHLLRGDRRVLYLTLEMPSSQVMMRLLGLEAGVDMGQLFRAGPEADTIRRFAAAVSLVSERWDRTLRIVSGSQGLSSIRSEVADWRPDVWVVDQVGLVTADGDTRAQTLSGLVYSLKGLASDSGTVCLMVHQLSRAIESRAKALWQPLMSDLKDSGGVEEVADCIVCIVREYLVTHAVEDQHRATIYHVKNRRTGEVGMTDALHGQGGHIRPVVDYAETDREDGDDDGS